MRARAKIAAVLLAALVSSACATITPVSPTPALTASPSPAPTTPPTLPASPTATPTHAPTPAATPTAQPTVRPTPTANPFTPESADDILGTIVDFSQNEVPFVVDEVGTFAGEAGGETGAGDIQISGQVRGADFAGQVTISQPGVVISYDIVVIGEQSWTRPSGSDWQEGPTGQTGPLQPIHDLTLEDLSYVGVFYFAESRFPMHRVKINRWTGPDFRDLGLRKPVLTLISYEIIANNAGYPQTVELDYRLVGRLAGAPFDFTYYMTYSMSNFGLPVTIEAPI